MACSCESLAATRPSCMICSRILAASASGSPAVESTCLMATSRSSNRSCASHTAPMPPPPSFDCRR
ncbi:Uncharacterised protein [Mycobacteroides abscessus subsp. abscessus]|nr:Uncharacterised protein [Mycobacteroides abscessus subsp. abscessus]